VLEWLERVDWLSLTHAYGPAGDVPGFIRGLAAADPGVRSGARHALYGNVFHQGTRYEASSYALPFLIELACERAVPDRDELLRLIAHLAVGYQEGYLLRDGFDRASAKAEQDALRSMSAGPTGYVAGGSFSPVRRVLRPWLRRHFAGRIG
jgi:hypothetical protein